MNKELQEIKETLEKATGKGDWNIGKASPNGLQNIGHRGLMICQAFELADARLIANAPEWLRLQDAEITRLQASEQAWKKIAAEWEKNSNWWKSACDYKDADIKQLNEELEFSKKQTEMRMKETDDIAEQLNQAVEVLKDCKYQIEQSNHPAGLGMLVSINNFLSSLGTEEA